MADVTKSTRVLQLVGNFADEDTRTFTLDNPKANVTASEINALSSFMQTNNILIGDKNGAAFSRINSAKVIEGTTVYLDLS